MQETENMLHTAREALRLLPRRPRKAGALEEWVKENLPPEAAEALEWYDDRARHPQALPEEERAALGAAISQGIKAEERQREAGETLPPEEAAALREAIRAGQRAEAVLCGAHLPLVLRCVRRYEGRGVDTAALLYAGDRGLAEAVRRSGREEEQTFLRQADWWITQALISVLMDATQVHRAAESLTVSLGHSPACGELAEFLDWEEDRVGFALDSLRPPEEKPPHREPDPPTAEELSGVLPRLGEREGQVVRYRFGLEGETAHSSAETAEHCSICEERVDQIGRKAARLVFRSRHRGEQ